MPEPETPVGGDQTGGGGAPPPAAPPAGGAAAPAPEATPSPTPAPAAKRDEGINWDFPPADIPGAKPAAPPAAAPAAAPGAKPAATPTHFMMVGDQKIPGTLSPDGTFQPDQEALTKVFVPRTEFQRGLDNERLKWNERGGEMLEQLLQRLGPVGGAGAAGDGEPTEEEIFGKDPGENLHDPATNPAEWRAHENAATEYRMKKLMHPYAAGMQELRSMVEETVSRGERSQLTSRFQTEFEDATKELGLPAGSTPQTDRLRKLIYRAVGVDPEHVGNVSEKDVVRGMRGKSTRDMIQPWAEAWKASVQAEAHKLAKQMIASGEGVLPNPHGAGGAGVPPGAGVETAFDPMKAVQLVREGKMDPKQAIRALMGGGAS